MKKSAVALAALLAACSLPPEVLPPPFGPVSHGQARLFFPSGLAVAPDNGLLVANGNFDRSYDAGSIVRLRPDFVAAFFRNSTKVSCDVPNAPANCDRPIPADSPVVMIGNYAGPVLVQNGIAYTGSRDTGKLNAVALGADGSLHCAPGTGSDPDCRAGTIDLAKGAKIDGPFSLTMGDAIISGQSAPQPVLFVSSVVPHIENITGGVIQTSSAVAALSFSQPPQVLFTQPATIIAETPGDPHMAAPGAMVYDPTRRVLFLAGCYERFPGTGAGEPSSGKCIGLTSNLLRVVPVDGNGQTLPQFIDLYGDVLSVETTQILLADPDPADPLHQPRTLWATMRNPDTLVQVALPAQPSVQPRVRRIVPLPISPADMMLISRPPLGDLIVVVAEKLGGIAVYDVAQQQVVAQVERLGDSPFTLVRLPCPDKPDGPGADSACLSASVFGECKVAMVEVPLATPWNAALRGRAGGCP